MNENPNSTFNRTVRLIEIREYLLTSVISDLSLGKVGFWLKVLVEFHQQSSVL